MHFFCKFLSEFCPNSSYRGPQFDSWQEIEISRHLWQPDVSFQGAGGGLSTHCSALLSRAAASTLLSTKKGSMSTPKVVFFMRLQYHETVQSCFAMFCFAFFAWIFPVNMLGDVKEVYRIFILLYPMLTSVHPQVLTELFLHNYIHTSYASLLPWNESRYGGQESVGIGMSYSKKWQKMCSPLRLLFG